jgi:UDP-N-acetylmuramoyl-tripeptide--D-alanyl-D-alanine ligase
MTLLWTPEELAEATGAAPPPAGASGVSIDSRTLEPGELFVALRAARDGHGFVADALAKGAAIAMVDHVPEGVARSAARRGRAAARASSPSPAASARRR